MNFNASTTINAGVNCPTPSGAWQESLGGNASPIANQGTLESSPTSGSIVVAPDVTVTGICGSTVEFNAVTQVFGSGSQFICEGITNQMTIETAHLTNNGQIIDYVPNSNLAIINDNNGAPNPANADIEGPIQIFGNGSVSTAGTGGSISIITEGPGQPSLIDPIVFYGNQTFTTTGSILVQANRGIAFANSTTQTIISANLILDAPATTNNGTIVVVGSGTIILQNSSLTSAHTLVTNNGIINNAASAPYSFGIDLFGSTASTGNIDSTVNGIGTFLTAGGDISFSSPPSTTLAVTGSLTINAGTGFVLFFSNSNKLPIVFGDGSASTITLTGDTVYLSAPNITLSNLVSLALIGTGTQRGSGVSFNTPSISVAGGGATLSITTYDIGQTGIGAGTTVDVGTGTVSLLPVSTQELIVVAGSRGNFNVPASVLSAITASNVVIGQASSSAGIILGGSYTMPRSGAAGTTAGLYNLDLENDRSGGTIPETDMP